MTRWRLLVDPPGDPAWNLAVDEALLLRADVTASFRPTLRLYSWCPPALSLGRWQSTAQVARDALARRAAALVRRPTGGSAVFHDDERTYAVVARLRQEPFPGGVVDTYRRIARALVTGLRGLGVDASARAPLPRRERRQAPASCFAEVGGYEVVAGGRKLAGAAQVRARRAFLQHGSILRRCDVEQIRDALAGAEPGVLTDLARELGAPPTSETIDAAIVAGFASAFGCELARDSLTEEERTLARSLVDAKYARTAWTATGR